ncbi:MAG: FAD-dependent oxidoreductase [Candidatus Rokubacteria bacterium]|nr:FAD-dependent oxidoreductase [Candidatus Rokubacteria bacterium]
MPETAEVVVVGGGVAGLALAVELKRRGAGRTIVLERSYLGSGATGRNVGRLRAMQLTETLTRLALRCQAKYEWIGDELGFNVLFWRPGYLWLLYDSDEIDRMRPVVAMHHRLGVRSELLDPAGVYRLVPHLRSGEPVAGGVGHARDAIVHHDAVVWAYGETARRLGVEVRQNAEVSGIEVRRGRVEGVRLGSDRIAATRVVNAAGAWAGQVSALAGLPVPNMPVRREVLVTAPVKPFLPYAITFYRPAEGWFNQTLRGEVVAGVVDLDEPPGLNSSSSFGFLTRTATLLVRKMPALARLTVIRQWAGMYDVTPDHLPQVGGSGRVAGFYQANGWSGRGMLLAPYCAELLAAEMTTGKRPELLRPFDPDRFVGAEQPGTVERDYYQRYGRPTPAPPPFSGPPR